MNNYEIDFILKHHACTRKIYGGTFSRDNLPINTNGKQLFICNTDTSKGPGIHWVVLYFYKSGDVMLADYFDPLGFPPLLPIKKFLEKHAVSWTWNNKQIQNIESKACGFHTLFFSILRCLGYSMYNIIRRFSNNHIKNDFLVTKFISSFLCKAGHFGKPFCKYVLSNTSF